MRTEHCEQKPLNAGFQVPRFVQTSTSTYVAVISPSIRGSLSHRPICAPFSPLSLLVSLPLRPPPLAVSPHCAWPPCSSAAMDGGVGEDPSPGEDAQAAEPQQGGAPVDVPDVLVHCCILAAPVVVPPDLQAALADHPERVRPAVPRTHGFRQRSRRRRRPPPAPPVGGRRRQPAAGARGEGAAGSDASDDGAVAADVFHTESSDGQTDGNETASEGEAADVEEGLDMRPHVLSAISYYEALMTQELALALCNEPRPPNVGTSTLSRVAAVAGGAAVVVSEGEKGYVTWLESPRDALVALCSCGGRRGAESVEVREMLGVSSSCVHARALLASASKIASLAELDSELQLLERWPVLDNARSARVHRRVVHFATHTSLKRGVFAVLCDGMWSVVTIRQRAARSATTKRMVMRAACTQLSCAKRHWGCLHARAVTEWCVSAAAAGPAVPPLSDVPGDVLLVDVAGAAPRPRRRQRAEGGGIDGDGRYSDETRWRAARNMLPCAGDIDDCSLWELLAESGRRTGGGVFFPVVLYEDRCFSCRARYTGLQVKNTGGTLHTLRGRVAVRLRQWTCACGRDVFYDGSQDGLFASTSKTVFTRTFMDMMAQMVFTGHSTLSSATGVATLLLEVTKSLPDGEHGLSRQTLIKAVHRFSRTLLVPAVLFRCSKCYLTEQRPYPAVISDGEVISVQRNQSEVLVRQEENVPVASLDTGHGSCLFSPALRAVVRKRSQHDLNEPLPLTVAERTSLTGFMDDGAAVPDPHVAHRVKTRPGNVRWAAAFVFSFFYSVEEDAGEPAPAAPAGPQAVAHPPLVGLPAAADGPAAAADDGAAGDGAAGQAAPLPLVQPAPGAPGDNPLPAGAIGPGEELNGAPVHGPHAVGAAPARRHVCVAVDGAVGVCADAAVAGERWRAVNSFVHTFLGEPIIGAFAGLRKSRIKRLAVAMVLSTEGTAWKQRAAAVESVRIVWPFLRLVFHDIVVDQFMVRAVGELLLFACGIDAYWETLWRGRASDAALAFERQWRQTSTVKFKLWVGSRPGGAQAPSLRLSFSRFSAARGAAQAKETLTGHVWPDLEPVRTFMIDAVADAVNERRAAKVKHDRAALEAELNRVLGVDDCRHTFVSSDFFMPGIENFLCPCGMLLGFDFLDKAESPAHVLAALAQRFPLLPKVIYFDTACQLARNASRRVPWLINMSGTACSVDRVHNTGNQHKCSDVFDADAYPSRSVTHSTAVAESRHSINKAFKAHLSHLRQDHFIVQMRVLAATINLRVLMRREWGKETLHRRLAEYFHSKVQTYCERRACSCANFVRQFVGAAADGNGAADGHAVDGAAPAAAAPVECGLQEEPMRDETDQDAIIKQLSDRLAARRRIDAVNDALPVEADVEDSEEDAGEHSGGEFPSSGSEAGDGA